MKQPADWFEGCEPHLLYIAGRLSEAQRIESVLTDAGVDYGVEADQYESGRIFRSIKIGAFFYVRPESRAIAEEALRRHGIRPSTVKIG